MAADAAAAVTRCPVAALTAALIERPSVTPDDAGCQALVAERLAASGFACEHFRFGAVDNLVAWHGSAGPAFAFLGHTDVVPAGPGGAWSSPPFTPTVRDGRLHGRGAADMKGAVAAFVLALERFVAAYPDHPGRVGLLLTSDEEGPAQDGIRRLVPALAERGDSIDWCLVGEPSSRRRLGDTIRIGRRGSLNIALRIHGIQGHAAYPQLADNPVHRALPALAELTATRWDDGDDAFPPTSFQIAQVAAGSGVYNVIPGALTVRCNFRYAPCFTPEALLARVRATLARHDLRYDLEHQDSGRPFLTREPALRAAVVSACRHVLGIRPEANTGGGTSDGRFVAPTGAEVVELGVVNASIHQVDEHVVLADLARLAAVYEHVVRALLAGEARA